MIEALAGGHAGRIVPQRDPRALATGISECLEEPDVTEEKTQMAMYRVHSHYGLTAIMDQTTRLWEGAI
jgi:hypothetical protein